MSFHSAARATLCGAILGLSACFPPTLPAPGALEVQSFQTRELEASRDIAFASVMSVFQDLGYVIQSADKETGFITANSPATSTTDWLLTGNRYNSQTRATAFIDSIRSGFTTVRLNLVVSNQTSSWYGQAGQTDKPILDPQPYQVAFERIEDAVFVRSGRTEVAPAATDRQ